MAFLFTDVEGSTRLWEEHPEAMAEALSVHDRALIEVIEDRGGHVFSTAGDAFCAAFSSVGSAVSTAAAAQDRVNSLEVAGEPLRVRMAIHVGEAVERDGNYFGPVLNRTARLMAIGHGGQVLLSALAVSLLQPEGGVDLVDLGEHRLKDLSVPEHVHQLMLRNAEDSFPPLRSVSVTQWNLPIQLTSFVGRDAEVAAVITLVESERLVTLTGVGGVGKTRLALQAAAELVDKFDGGVWLVELAALTDPAVLTSAIARVLRVDETSGPDLDELMLQRIGQRSMLLVLDNCEHLIDEAAKTVAFLLGHASGLKVLATSRELLGVPGEAAYSVPSMSSPDSGAAGVDQLLDFDAVRLFVSRARASDRSFELAASNASHVAEICRRLDGVPLALELAAGRLRTLTPAQIAQHLDTRFRLLTGGARTALPRQQTLQATLDWSHQLLSGPEQILFRRLAVFSGFDLDAVGAVCADETLDTYQVLEGIGSLVDKSLISVQESDVGRRYRLLETVRQYALDKLADSGDGPEFRERHALHFGGVAASISDDLLDGPADLAVMRGKSDFDNINSALWWAVEHDATELAARIAADFAPCLDEMRVYRDPYRWFEAVLSPLTEANDLRAVLCSWAMNFAATLGLDEETVHWQEELDANPLPVSASARLRLALNRSSVAALRGAHREGYRILSSMLETAEREDPRYLQPILHDAIAWASSIGIHDDVLIQRCVALAEETRQGRHLYMAHGLAAWAYVNVGEYDKFFHHNAIARVHAETSGNRWGLAMSDLQLARVALLRGETDEARPFALRALTAMEELDHPSQVSVAARRLTKIALIAGDLPEAISWAKRIDFEHHLWVSAQVVAEIAFRLGYHNDSARLVGYHQGEITRRDFHFNPDERATDDAFERQVRHALGEEAGALMDEGASMNLEDAIALAKGLLYLNDPASRMGAG